MDIWRTTIIALLLGAVLPASAQVLSPRSERISENVVRLYGGDMFVRPDGKTWREIPDVVSIEQDGSAWVVSYGPEWIRLTPSAPIVSKRVVLESKRFGPILDKATAPDSILYNVTYSAGVVATADGWRFKDIPDDVWLGVCVHDWQWLLGEKLAMTANSATLDLTAVKLTPGDEINLDPTIVATTNSGFLSAFGSDWGIIRTNDSFILPSQNDDINASASLSVPNFFLNRAYTRMDTSPLATSGTIQLVTWNAKTKSRATTNTLVLYSLVSDYGGLDGSEWNAPVGAVEGTNDMAALESWDSFAVAPSSIKTTEPTCFMLRELLHDVNNVAPDGSVGGSYYGPNADATNVPFLDIMLVTANPAIIDFDREEQRDEATATVTFP